MFRFSLAAFALIPLAFSQNLPAYLWSTEVDHSGTDSFAGLGVDAQGNTYLAGSTYAATFPVKNAVQNHPASAGLYRMDGPGSAYAALGLTSASAVGMIDPLKATTLYAVSSGALLRSTDGGRRHFRRWRFQSQQVQAAAIDPTSDQILYACAPSIRAS